MPEEKTLLQQIREKEQEVNVHLEAVVKETDNERAQARKDADEILAQSERKGTESAKILLAQEQEKMRTALDTMKKNAGEQENSMKQSCEKNLSRAVDQIVRYVVMD
jgi:vacuolar-type H+-ATPase subunit H